MTSIGYTNSPITVISHSMTGQGVRSHKRLEMDLAKIINSKTSDIEFAFYSKVPHLNK
jgi:hypothetical protein